MLWIAKRYVFVACVRVWVCQVSSKLQLEPFENFTSTDNDCDYFLSYMNIKIFWEFLLIDSN